MDGRFTTTNVETGILVSVAAIVITMVLLVIQRMAIRVTDSQAVKADHLHYQSDILLNAAVLVALVLSQFGMHWADGVFAILIALYLIWGRFASALRHLIVDGSRTARKLTKESGGYSASH